MFAEALTWLTTSCRPEARRLGYLKEAIALEYRARRCAVACASHLAQSQEFLLDSAGEGGKLGVVLGSGLLLDIPLSELCARFERLVLVDMVHLPRIRRLARRFPQVDLLEADVTGVVRGLYNLSRQKSACSLVQMEACFASRPELPRLPGLEGADWVASVNLLSQLPLLPLAWAERLCPQVDESHLLRWQETLLSHHLCCINAFAPRRCLLADRRQEVRNPEGTTLEVMDYGSCLEPVGEPLVQWSWQLIPPEESGENKEIVHLVQGWSW
ncbi:MAG: hypothetical protein ACRDD3_09990 [Azovibrio sp.]